MLEEKISKIKKRLPEIEKVRESKPKAEAIILQGVEGFKAMRRDIIKNSSGLLLMLGGVGKEDKVMPLFFDKWNMERRQKLIKFKALFKQNVKKTRWVKDSLADEFRFLPDHIDNPAVINIYGDRVVNVLWKGDYPICFMVINKEMADAYSKYFDLLWKNSSKK